MRHKKHWDTQGWKTNTLKINVRSTYSMSNLIVSAPYIELCMCTCAAWKEGNSDVQTCRMLRGSKSEGNDIMPKEAGMLARLWIFYPACFKRRSHYLALTYTLTGNPTPLSQAVQNLYYRVSQKNLCGLQLRRHFLIQHH